MLRDYCERHALPSLDLFLALVEDSPDFIYTKDRQFRYLSINAAAAAAIGKAPAEIIGRDDFDLLPHKVAKAIRAVDVTMLADGLSRTSEETVTLNGKARRFSTAKHVFRGSDGDAIGLVGISRDITDLYNARIALQEAAAEERARRAEIAAMMEAIPAAIFIAHDPQCRHMTGNRMVHKILKVPVGKYVSKSAPHHATPQNFEAYAYGKKLAPDELPVQRAAATGRAVKDIEIDLTFDDGSKRSILGSALPLFDERGASRGAVGAFVDISKYKKMQQKLQEANRAKENFFGILGHELRNPLSALNNCILLHGQTDDPELRAAAQEVMERQLAQLNRLANDLLDVNRVANGKLRIEKAPINLNKMLSAAADANRPLIENQGHIFTVTLPSSAAIVNGDFTRLIEVVANLLHNAAKFTPAGGLIRLSAKRIETNAIISIKDTGVGIPQHLLSTIFEPYAQVEPDAQKQGGLGIGLALVKHIVQLHDGTVRALSDGPNTGAEFIVQLPILDTVFEETGGESTLEK